MLFGAGIVLFFERAERKEGIDSVNLFARRNALLLFIGLAHAYIFWSGDILVSYALCGFANFASIGIQIGGIGALAPGQRQVLTELGIKSLIGGTVACFLTAAIAGMLY